MEQFDTNRGPLTPGQIVDELQYISYATNRDLGMTLERLARFFGDIPAQEFERRYRAEKIESDAATRTACQRCGDKHAGGCSSGFEADYQSEQHAIRDGSRY